MDAIVFPATRPAAFYRRPGRLSRVRSVRHFEPTLKAHLPAATLPEGIYQLADTVVAFDHARRSLFLIANVLDGDEAAAQAKLDEIVARIHQPIPASVSRPVGWPEKSFPTKPGPNSSKWCGKPGNISRRAIFFRWSLRSALPAPLMPKHSISIAPSAASILRRICSFLTLGSWTGSRFTWWAPRLKCSSAWRGGTPHCAPSPGLARAAPMPTEDAALAEELLADPKERAEHVMLVDLGRNDLGRVCEYGSVSVPEFFNVERYSHVMHIVSHVEGTLRPDLTAFDLVRASFPAGTVSGAPKVRAMEIIAELEGQPRNIYSGMVGYFGFDGAMDTCIAIRTLVAHGNNVTIQAGAGIVADSDPASEYNETVNKAKAMLRAIEAAETNG